jgi:hypothetical protein
MAATRGAMRRRTVLNFILVAGNLWIRMVGYYNAKSYILVNFQLKKPRIFSSIK